MRTYGYGKEEDWIEFEDIWNGKTEWPVEGMKYPRLYRMLASWSALSSKAHKGSEYASDRKLLEPLMEGVFDMLCNEETNEQTIENFLIDDLMPLLVEDQEKPSGMTKERLEEIREYARQVKTTQNLGYAYGLVNQCIPELITEVERLKELTEPKSTPVHELKCGDLPSIGDKIVVSKTPGQNSGVYFIGIVTNTDKTLGLSTNGGPYSFAFGAGWWWERIK